MITEMLKNGKWQFILLMMSLPSFCCKTHTPWRWTNVPTDLLDHSSMNVEYELLEIADLRQCIQLCQDIPGATLACTVDYYTCNCYDLYLVHNYDEPFDYDGDLAECYTNIGSTYVTRSYYAHDDDNDTYPNRDSVTMVDGFHIGDDDKDCYSTLGISVDKTFLVINIILDDVVPINRIRLYSESSTISTTFDDIAVYTGGENTDNEEVEAYGNMDGLNFVGRTKAATTAGEFQDFKLPNIRAKHVVLYKDSAKFTLCTVEIS